MPQTVLPCHHAQLCRFPSQDTGTLLSLCSPPPSTSHLLHLPHFWVWKLYSTSLSHRAPSSRSCTFLSEIKKNAQSRASSSVALQLIQSAGFCATRTFYRQTLPTLQPGLFHTSCPSLCRIRCCRKEVRTVARED